MLDGGKALANRFVQLNTHLNNLNSEVNNGLLAGATEVNRLAQEIAQINGAIGTNIATAAPDLLDRRDQLITQLIGYTGGTAVIQDGGIMNVYTAGGNALVVGTTATKVTTVADPYQPERLQLALETQGNTIRLDPKAVGGQIGGLLEFRDTVLTPAQAELGKLAVGLAESFNQVHHQGVDLYGQLGVTSSTSAIHASPPTMPTPAPPASAPLTATSASWTRRTWCCSSMAPTGRPVVPTPVPTFR